MIRTVDGCRTDGWGASRCYLRGLEHFLAVICRTDGWDGWKGDVNIDAGDGFSYRLNHMRAAANGEDEQYLVLARPRPNIGHVYLPISSSFTSLPNPPIHSQARPQPTADRGHHKLYCDWTTPHQPHKTRADITITTRAHAHPISSHLASSPSQGPRAQRHITSTREQDTMRATSRVFEHIQY